MTERVRRQVGLDLDEDTARRIKVLAARAEGQVPGKPVTHTGIAHAALLLGLAQLEAADKEKTCPAD